MNNFLKWGGFIMSLILLGAVLYDVNENRKMREGLKKKMGCSCNEHPEYDPTFISGGTAPQTQTGTSSF